MNISLNNDLINNIYYNFNIRKKENEFDTYTAVNDTRTQAIINNPSDYEIAVARFSLPTYSLPVFIWKGNEYFQLVYTYGITKIFKYVKFSPSISNNNIYGDCIWTYQQFIDLINKALKEAFTDLKTAEPLCPATEPAFLYYNAKTRLLVWNTEQAYGTTTKVYFNQELFFLMPSFSAFGTTINNILFWEMKSKDNKNNHAIINGINYFSTKQEYPTVYLWKNFKTIIFQTDNIPVNSEYTMSQQNDFRRVLTDFEVVQGDLDEKQVIQYYPRAEMRWYDLMSSQQLRKMDIKVYWGDNTGKIYPLFLDTDNFIFTMKLYLRKKIK